MLKNFVMPLVASLPLLAFADFDTKPIERLTQKMEAAILKRNRLLDQIGIPRHAITNDTNILTDINQNELDIEELAGLFVVYLKTLNNTKTYNDKEVGKKLLGEFKSNASSICATLKLQMIVRNDETENVRIKKEIAAQIANTDEVCDILSGLVVKGNRPTAVYNFD